MLWAISEDGALLIGEEITFLHNNVTKGLIEVSIDGRIYDSKLFVK